MAEFTEKALMDLDKRLKALEKRKINVKELPLTQLREAVLRGEPQDPIQTLLPQSIALSLLGEDVIKELAHYAVGDQELVFDLGETSVTYVAAADSEITTVAHRLEVEPIFIGAALLEGEGTVLRAPRITEKTSSVFKMQFNAEAVLNKTDAVMWIAVGLK